MDRRRLLLLLPLLLAACGGDDDGGGGEAEAARLEIEGFEFPESLTVPAGAEVTVVNADAEPHTVTADDGGFDSGSVRDEGSFTAPTEPGSYAYHCNVHPTMTATLVVEEA